LDLSITKEQLTFWRVGLNKTGEQLHDKLLDLLEAQSVHSNAMNSQINYFYFHEKTYEQQLTSQLEGWKKIGTEIIKIHEEILSSGFIGIFGSIR
jgi:hypothetical protein